MSVSLRTEGRNTVSTERLINVEPGTPEDLAVQVLRKDPLWEGKISDPKPCFEHPIRTRCYEVQAGLAHRANEEIKRIVRENHN